LGDGRVAEPRGGLVEGAARGAAADVAVGAAAPRRGFGLGGGAGILFVNLKWNDEQDIHWEYVDCLCLVQIKQNMFVILDNQLKQAEKM
jgi:hypothetical protein